MRIREYSSTDLIALQRMHAAQGFGYPLPDLNSPLFISKLVLEDEGDGGAQESGDEGREQAQHNFANARDRGSCECNAPKPDSSRAHGDGSSPRLAMAILQRLTAETYLLHDPAAGTPRLRWKHFLALHEVARRDAAAHGLDDVQAFLPPQVARSFGRRLQRLGWSRDPWHCYTLRIT